jgi:HAD superfamily hydrolase (TIGR01509 family)
MFPRLEQEHGRTISDELRQHVADATREALATRLQPIPGVHEALQSLRLPKCVASGSEAKRVRLSLACTGLSEHFDSNIFTRDQVDRGKPAPDIFLLAAERMRVRPERCVVIEDSQPGVAAGVAAGMCVLGFTGASHCGPDRAAQLRDAGAHRVFDSMSQLVPLLHGLNEGAPSATTTTGSASDKTLHRSLLPPRNRGGKGKG